MTEKKREPVDFLKVVEGIKADQMTLRKQALKEMRDFYLALIEAGFSLEEAMAFIAALVKTPQEGNK